MRRLLIASVAAVALAGCGKDDIANSVRDKAEEVRRDAERALDGASLEDVRRELDKVRDELDGSDIPEDARRELEQARDRLERELNR